MKLDKKTIAIIVLSLIILAGFGFLGYVKIRNYYYNLGFIDGVYEVNSVIYKNLVDVGYVVYQFPVNETATTPIKLIPIAQSLE